MNSKITTETLVAYLLGELEKPERVAVEQALEQDPMLRAEAAELKATMGLVTEALAHPVEELTTLQREAVLEEADRIPKPVRWTSRVVRLAVWSTAAVILLAAGLVLVTEGPASPRFFTARRAAEVPAAVQERHPQMQEMQVQHDAAFPSLGEAAPAMPGMGDSKPMGGYGGGMGGMMGDMPQAAPAPLPAGEPSYMGMPGMEGVGGEGAMQGMMGGGGPVSPEALSGMGGSMGMGLGGPVPPGAMPGMGIGGDMGGSAEMGNLPGMSGGVSGTQLTIPGMPPMGVVDDRGSTSAPEQIMPLDSATMRSDEVRGEALKKEGGLKHVQVGGEIRLRPQVLPPGVDSPRITSMGRKFAGDVVEESMQYFESAPPEDFRAVRPGANPPEMEDPSRVYAPGFNTEGYDAIVENPFLDARQNPLSTFSIDVDTASYANVRRYLTQNTPPPPASVRIEELVNYFDYSYAPPEGGGWRERPFAAHTEVAACPWKPEHKLLKIGLKGWDMPPAQRPAANLVFLVDVSGSMRPPNKLPLLKEALRLLAGRLDERDTVSMVVYAGSSGMVLPPTNGENRQAILDAINRLESGGSTNAGEGIELAYRTAVENFIQGGVNRVILATDGDFNVGLTDRGGLDALIEEKAKSGVFLSVLGFGMGNIKDGTLEALSNKGNGNYAYIDSIAEARKVLVDGMTGTLVTIAKDVKIQVEFNPARVGAYRLIGYENRILRAEDFNDDTKDAGEIGAGHTVTALYEIVPAGVPFETPPVDPLKYQQPAGVVDPAASGELLTLKLRFKQPDGDVSKLLEFPVTDSDTTFAAASEDFRFAASVASFGMLLRGSQHVGASDWDRVREWAQGATGEDPFGYRTEFLGLVGKAAELSRR